MAGHNTNKNIHYDSPIISRHPADQQNTKTATDDGLRRNFQKQNAALQNDVENLRNRNFELSEELQRLKSLNPNQTTPDSRGEEVKRHEISIKGLNESVQSYRDRCNALQKQINDLKNNNITVDNLTDFVIPNQDYQIIKALLKENRDLTNYINQFNQTRDMHEKVTSNLTPTEANHVISRLELDNKILRDRLGMSEEEEPCYSLLSSLDKEAGITNIVTKLESQLQIVGNRNTKLKQCLDENNKYNGSRSQPPPPYDPNTNNLKIELDRAKRERDHMKRELNALSATLSERDKEIEQLKSYLQQHHSFTHPAPVTDHYQYRTQQPMQQPMQQPISGTTHHPTAPPKIPYHPHSMHHNFGSTFPGGNVGGMNPPNS